jgi:hypothetical protein
VVLFERLVTDCDVPLTVRLLYPVTKLEKLLTVETSRRYEVALETLLQLDVNEVDAIFVAACAVGGLKMATFLVATRVDPPLLNSDTLPVVLVVFHVIVAE